MPRQIREHTESQHKRTYLDIQNTASREDRLTQRQETHYAYVFCQLEPNLDISGKGASRLRNGPLQMGL